AELHRRMILLNCVAPVALCHAFVPSMIARRSGGVIFVSSAAAFQGMPYTSVYAASKSFDLLLGEALRFEWAAHGVEVLTICPGPTDTEGPRRSGVIAGRVPGKMMQVEPVV